jgi:hypothetical protein
MGGLIESTARETIVEINAAFGKADRRYVSLRRLCQERNHPAGHWR